MRRLLLMLLGAASALAQPVTIGFKGGIPLSDFFSAPGQNAYGLTFDFGENFNRCQLGPTVEVRLPRGFAIEADVIFRHLNYNGKVLQFGQWGPNYQTQGLTGAPPSP
jgi:hypothetical protein